ncbi:MAG TPA: serine protease [Candidatus Obscuribacterales bacterium]
MEAKATFSSEFFTYVLSVFSVKYEMLIIFFFLSRILPLMAEIQFPGAGNQSDLSSSPKKDSLADLMLREAQVIFVGTGKGIAQAAEHAVTHPAETGVKVGVGWLTGAAMTAMQTRVPRLRPVALVATAAFGTAFLVDVGVRAGEVWGALKDTAGSPENLDKNTDIVASAVGPAIVDGALMTVGGYGGFKNVDKYLTGPNGKYVRIPTLWIDAKGSPRDMTLYSKKHPLAMLFEREKDSIVRVRQWNGSGTARSLTEGVGTGFFVREDGLIATNAHVADKAQNLVVSTRSGKEYWAKVLDIDHDNDIALLYLARETPGEVFRPVKLAKSIPNQADEIAAIGFPQNSRWRKQFVSPGRFGGETSRTSLVRTPSDVNIPYNRNVISVSNHPGIDLPAEPGRYVVNFAQDGRVTAVGKATGAVAEQFELKTGKEFSSLIHVEPGNSGSPKYLLSTGEVVSIVTKRGDNSGGMSTPAAHIRALIDRNADKVIKRLKPWEEAPRV